MRVECRRDQSNQGDSLSSASTADVPGPAAVYSPKPASVTGPTSSAEYHYGPLIIGDDGFSDNSSAASASDPFWERHLV